MSYGSRLDWMVFGFVSVVSGVGMLLIWVFVVVSLCLSCVVFGGRMLFIVVYFVVD